MKWIIVVIIIYIIFIATWIKIQKQYIIKQLITDQDKQVIQLKQYPQKFQKVEIFNETLENLLEYLSKNSINSKQLREYLK